MVLGKYLIMKRNILLDYSRLVLAILILIIHTDFAIEIPILGFMSDTVARLAVPVFFVINGYFLESKISDKIAVNKYLKHLVLIYLVWTIVYIPFMDFKSSQLDLGILRYIVVIISGYFHLWYIAALILSVLILRIFKNISLKIIVTISCLFHLLGLVINRLYLFDIQIPTSTLTTNFLFVGLFYVSIGSYIKRYDIISRMVNFKSLYSISLVCFIVLLIEGYMLFLYGKPSSFYIALPLLCPLLFIVLMKKGKTSEVSSGAANLSASVYFVHPMVIYLLRDLSIPYTGTSLFLVVLFLSFMLGASACIVNKSIRCLL